VGQGHLHACTLLTAYLLRTWWVRWSGSIHPN